MNTVERYYKQAPPLGKNAIVVVGVVLFAGAAWLLYRGIKKNKEESDANDAGKAAETDISILERDGQRRTLNDSNLTAMVQALVQAMNGCGTDEDAIYNVFDKCRNDLDVLYLIKKFGVQYYEPCEWTQPVAYIQWKLNDQSFGGDLPTWFNYDLNQDEVGEINSILQAKGISIQF